MSKHKNNFLKIVFGVIIFMFSLALAYFVANYFGDQKIMEYGLTLIMIAGIYVLVGVGVSNVFPVSLGFLFSADVLILHILYDRIGDVDVIYKTILVGFVLAVLYIFAWRSMPDD